MHRTHIGICLSTFILALAGCASDAASNTRSDGGDTGDSGGSGGDTGSDRAEGGTGSSSAGDTGAGNAADGSVRDATDARVGDDAGTLGTASDAEARSDGTAQKKRVFVSKGKWDGNLKLAATMAGSSVATGLAGGDALCSIAATAGGLGGTWLAWLSDSTTNAIDRIRDVGPWYGIDGVEVFESKAALAGNPLAAIVVNEIGTMTDLANWTGTLANGTKDVDTCQDWTSNSAREYGMCGYGNSTTDQKWSEGVVPLCNNPYNLYCFEQ